jgi:hypothetical protein
MVVRPELLVGDLRPLHIVAKPSDAAIIGESTSNEFATALAHFCTQEHSGWSRGPRLGISRVRRRRMGTCVAVANKLREMILCELLISS